MALPFFLFALRGPASGPFGRLSKKKPSFFFRSRTPFKTPYEFSELELDNLLAKGISQVGDAKDLILVSHTPPFQTKTDKLLNGAHVGSTAVRTFIEQQQPLLCLTGHIHESRGRDYIGRTLIVNPGMIKDGGYIEVLFENGEISASLYP